MSSACQTLGQERLPTGEITLRVIVQDMGQPLPVLRIDRGNLGSELQRMHMDDLQAARQHSVLLEFDGELKRIAALHEQAAFNLDPCLANALDLARR